MNAASTLQFAVPFSGALATNFGDASGTSVSGLTWGLVIDAGGTGFADGGASYNAFNPGAGAALTSPNDIPDTDDVYIFGGTTSDTSALQEAGFTVSGANGTLGNISVNYGSGIDPSDAFAIVWFDGDGSNGSKYGFFNYGGVLPADGLVAADMTAPFVGVEPIRAADNTIGGAAPIPEPSRAVLAGLGLLGLFFRRRR